jgi:hypothetical protein
VSTVPTNAERNSGYTNFSDLITGQSGSRTDAMNRTFPSGAIFDPSTTRLVNGSYVREQFGGNQIPVSRLNPAALKLLQLLPAANGPGVAANYTSNPVFGDNTNSFDFRIDHNFSERDQMFVRYSYSFHEQRHSGPFSGPADGGNSKFNSNLDDRSQNAVVAETHSFSSRVFNEIRVGLNRESAIWLQPYADDSTLAQQYGISGIPQFKDNGGLPLFSVAALTGFGSTTFLPSRKYGTTPQLTDDVTWNKGTHNIKFGFMAQRISSPYTQPPGSRGSMSFSGAYTSIVNKTDSSAGIAQFLLSPAGSSNLAGANQVTLSNSFDHALRRNYVGAYVQDDWKISPKLTLNLGVRWERFSFLTDILVNNANFLPSAGFGSGTFLVTPALIDKLPSGFVSTLAAEGVAVRNANSSTLGNPQKLNFGPRVGIAYQITPKLVARAGFGMFYGGAEEIGGSPLLVENFPIEYSLTRTAVNAVTPITPDNSIGLIGNSFVNLSLAPSSTNPAGIALIGQEYNWKTQYTQSQNFFLQYQLSGASSLAAGYVGSVSRHIPVVLASNPVLQILPPGTNSTPYTPYPLTALSGGNYTTSQGSSNYNSLQVTYEKRFSRGLSVLATYTWAKILSDARDPLENDTGSYRAPYLQGFGIRQDYTLADFNVPRAVHFSGTYDLPLGTGRAFGAGWNRLENLAFGGWSTNWILTVQDGQPFTVSCPSATTTGFGCNALLVGGTNPYAASTVNHFVDAAAFVSPPAATAIGQTSLLPFGGSGGMVSGPAFRRLDFSLFKQFKISERVQAEFRGEIFNLTNTPNFANPSQLNLLNTVTFGKITATRDSPNDPRQIQFGVKLYW